MSYMVMEVTLSDNGLVELTGPNVRYWIGCGLPDYEGSLEGLKLAFPQVVTELVTRKIIKTHG